MSKHSLSPELCWYYNAFRWLLRVQPCRSPIPNLAVCDRRERRNPVRGGWSCKGPSHGYAQFTGRKAAETDDYAQL